MTELPSGKASVSCSPLPSSLRGLIEKWREEAARWRDDDATPYACEWADTLDDCIRELEALLAGAVPAPPQEELPELWRQAMYPHVGSEVFRQMLADLTARGWDDVREEIAALREVIAALPVPPAVPPHYKRGLDALLEGRNRRAPAPPAALPGDAPKEA